MATELSRRDIATAFMRLIAAGKVRDAYNAYVSADFRHHNPYFKGDRQSLLKAMEEGAVKNPNKILDIRHVLEDGELVAVLSHIKQSPEDAGGAVVHIFRFEGDKIVELWDIWQEIPPDSPNENGML